MKDIIGYEGLYAIEEDGRVWSYRSKKYMKPWIERNGYYKVRLNKDKDNKNKYIHILLAEAYIPNPNNYKTVDHIDRNRLNNDLSNLRWANASMQAINSGTGDIGFITTQTPVEMRDINNHDIILRTFNNCCEAAVIMFNDRNKNVLINYCANGKRESAYGYYWTRIKGE